MMANVSHLIVAGDSRHVRPSALHVPLHDGGKDGGATAAMFGWPLAEPVGLLRCWVGPRAAALARPTLRGFETRHPGHRVFMKQEQT